MRQDGKRRLRLVLGLAGLLVLGGCEILKNEFFFVRNGPHPARPGPAMEGGCAEEPSPGAAESRLAGG